MTQPSENFYNQNCARGKSNDWRKKTERAEQPYESVTKSRGLGKDERSSRFSRFTRSICFELISNMTNGETLIYNLHRRTREEKRFLSRQPLPDLLLLVSRVRLSSDSFPIGFPAAANQLATAASIGEVPITE